MESDKYRPAGLDRAVWKWECPPPDEDGRELLYQIVIPEVSLGTNITARMDDDFASLPMPQESEMVVLSLVRLPSCTRSRHGKTGGLRHVDPVRRNQSGPNRGLR